MGKDNSVIKAVIFDIGNVLVFYNHHIAAKKMSKIIKVRESKIFDILHGEKVKKISRMRDLGYSSRKYWAESAKHLKIRKIPYKEFDKLWNTIFRPNQKLFNLLKKLKRKYNLASISNTPLTHKKYFLKKYKIRKLLNPTIFSCDLKILKPDKRIYFFVLKKLKIKPKEAIFIDDKLENVKGARKIGINAIHFKNNSQLSKELKKFGIIY